MKYFTMLLSVFTFMSCINTKDVNAMGSNKKDMEHISGTYYVSSIEGNNYTSHGLTIMFDEKTNMISGFSGCNRFNGTYTIDGNSITLGPLATTRMHCQDNNNKMERQMFTALNNVNSIDIKNQELRLFNSDTQTILIKASKNQERKVTQESNYIIEYTAVNKGFYNHYIFENGKLSIQKDRSTAPTIKTFSKKETSKLIEEIKALDLEKLSTLEAPTQNRYVDADASVSVKITFDGKSYEIPDFDRDTPNKYITSFLSAFMELTQTQ
ncbi:MAG: META domain-containing protein [Xanthomarina sp.]